MPELTNQDFWLPCCLSPSIKTSGCKGVPRPACLGLLVARLPKPGCLSLRPGFLVAGVPKPIDQDCWLPGCLHLLIRIAGCQVPTPRCLSPPADSLDFRIAGCQVPKPRCLSPAADSLDFRIAGCQVPNPRCLSLAGCQVPRPASHSLDFRTAGCQVPLPRGWFGNIV